MNNIKRSSASVEFLDTTLRDGSYVIDFQFTADDTYTITRSLDRLGLKWIEVGHGLGINASESKGNAAASDVEYVEAARRAVQDSRIGMFCIPELAKLDHLAACIDAGLQFVRIGVNVQDYGLTKPFISLAKQRGIVVHTNFMKSYTMPPKEFAALAKYSADYGSDLIYLVDSAGGMMPDDVRNYLDALHNAVDIPLGFHGHNNLQLVVANVLASVDAGVDLVDTTLSGIGRSSGNPPTEIVVALLQRAYGACSGIDPLLVVNLAETLVSPLLKCRWEDTTKTVLGMAQVHSQYVDKIRQAADLWGKDFFSMIDEVGKINKLSLPDEVLNAAAKNAKPKGFLEESLGALTILGELKDRPVPDNVRRLAIKLNKRVAIVIVSDQNAHRVEDSAEHIRYFCGQSEAQELLSGMREWIAEIRYGDPAAQRFTPSDEKVS